MIANLGMYDQPALHPANDRFWKRIRAALGQGPDSLTRDRDLWEIWRSPELLLAQTCGMPYRTRLHGTVDLVGTPDYGLPGCPPGHYRSVLVVRADDPRPDEKAFAGATFAYNEALSQSGWSAPVLHLQEHGIAIGRLVQTGAHAASARAVATGQADLAGIDALTWELLRALDPVSEKLRVISATAPTPGLPLITARGRDSAALAGAVADAIDALPPADGKALHLKGLVQIPAQSYLAIPNAPPPAA